METMEQAYSASQKRIQECRKAKEVVTDPILIKMLEARILHEMAVWN